MRVHRYFGHSRCPQLEDLADNPCESAWKAYCRGGQLGIDLTTSNPTGLGLPLPSLSAAALLEAAEASYRPEAQGLLSARKAVAEAHRVVCAEQVQLFASTSEAFSALFKLFCQPGDAVLGFSPTYPLIELLANLEGLSFLSCPLQDCADEWSIDFSLLSGMDLSRVRAVVLVSPNNPTGHCASVLEAERLHALCLDLGIPLIIDEVFAPFRLGKRSERLPAFALLGKGEGLCISLGGLSKSCGLPQHKLSWAIFGGAEALWREALERLSYIADAMLSTATWVQLLLPMLLAERGHFIEACSARLAENASYLEASCRSEGSRLRYMPLDGAWTASLRLPRGYDDEEIARRLALQGVRVLPGGYFGYLKRDPMLIVSLLLEPDYFRAGIDLLFERLERCLS